MRGCVEARLVAIFGGWIDEKVTAFENPLLAEQQVTEETFKVSEGIVDALRGVLVVGANQCIAEVPRMFGKEVVINHEPQRAQVLDGEDRRGARVALAEGMYLPQT